MRRIVLAEGVRNGLLLGGFMLLLLVVVTLPVFPMLLETPFVVVGVVVPVAVYGLTGFQGERQASRLRAGALAGALAGAVSGAISGLSFLGVDQIFFDTVSKQPEKILNFQASGLPTMRDYLVSNDLRNIVMGIVLGTLGGAIVGAVGALVSKLLPPLHKPPPRAAAARPQ